MRRNFTLFSLLFSIHHGLVTCPVVIATSALPQDVGYLGNMLLMIFTSISAFVMGSPICEILGLKGGIILGMLLYVAYLLLFVTAVMYRSDMMVQMICYCSGSISGGIASGVMWTGQGAYFARSVDLISAAGQHHMESRPELTEKLASTFAVSFLLFESLSKLVWSFFEWTGIPAVWMGYSYVALSSLATLMMTRVSNLQSASPPVHWSTALSATARLWRDPNVFLVSGLNLTFGFSAAFLTGYINANYTSKILGQYSVLICGTITVSSACVSAQLSEPLQRKIGKRAVIALGATSFLAIPTSMIIWGSPTSSWQWWLAFLYIFQGLGRGVYESTNKAVFADFFTKPEEQVGAFGNCRLQNSIGFIVGYFLCIFVSESVLRTVAMGLAIFSPIGYAIACLRKQRIHSEDVREDPFVGQCKHADTEHGTADADGTGTCDAHRSRSHSSLSSSFGPYSAAGLSH